MAAAKTTRPDLSFITSKRFENIDQHTEWMETLTHEQFVIWASFTYTKLPNLITCAEMLFDANIGNPDSPVFQIVSETLNEK